MRQPEPIRIATILLLPLALQGCSGPDRSDRVGEDPPPLRLEVASGTTVHHPTVLIPRWD